MSSARSKVTTRVLVGSFPPMIDLGLQHVFADQGCDVVRLTRTLTASTVRHLRPHALLVDLDDPAAVAAAERLVDEFPGLPVVECSSTAPRLRVFPAYQFGRSYEAPLTIPGLLEALAGP